MIHVRFCGITYYVMISSDSYVTLCLLSAQFRRPDITCFFPTVTWISAVYDSRSRNISSLQDNIRAACATITPAHCDLRAVAYGTLFTCVSRKKRTQIWTFTPVNVQTFAVSMRMCVVLWTCNILLQFAILQHCFYTSTLKCSSFVHYYCFLLYPPLLHCYGAGIAQSV
jgi:hypothetical protein